VAENEPGNKVGRAPSPAEGLDSCRFAWRPGLTRDQDMCRSAREGYSTSSRLVRKLFMRFATECSSDSMACFREMGRSGTDLGRLFGGPWQRGSTGILQSAERFGDGQGRLAKRAMIFQHPTRQHRFSSFLQPLIHQNSDLAPQISGVIQTGQLKTLQGRPRSVLEVVNWGNDARHGHGPTPMRRGDPIRRPTSDTGTVLSGDSVCLELIYGLWINRSFITHGLMVAPLTQNAAGPTGDLHARRAMKRNGSSQ
jgi:hypothetical protein